MDLKEWRAKTQRERVNELVDYFEGVANLAEFLGVPFSTVYCWQQRGRVSRNGAAIVERATKKRFSVGYLVPDASEWFQERQKAAQHGEN